MSRKSKTAETAEKGPAAASRIAMVAAQVAAPFRVRKYSGIITQAGSPAATGKGKIETSPFSSANI